MPTSSSPSTAAGGPADRPRRPARGAGIHAGENLAGWLFVAPMLVVLGLFLVVPIGMALYVSMTRWSGNGSPFSTANAPFVGLDNYTALFVTDGLTRRDFQQSMGNTFWYVLFVVPLQTVSALLLALVVNAKALKGKGFFRTAFYFPSVTSSIAITTVFIFLFSPSGAVNGFLRLLGITGPNWMQDADGVVHLALRGLGVQDDPSWARGEWLGRTWWEWLSGPSVAMLVIVVLAVWTTTGTFMLMFLAALQDLPEDVDEAAALDGVSPWQKLRYVTVPQLRPTIFLVVTLGLIGTWQVFDQVFATGGAGAPEKTLLTPAYLSYSKSFTESSFGTGSAMAFVIFLIIVVLTWFQRRVMDEDRPLLRRRRTSTTRGASEQAAVAAAAAGRSTTGGSH